jgi:hypothetical protein
LITVTIGIPTFEFLVFRTAIKILLIVTHKVKAANVKPFFEIIKDLVDFRFHTKGLGDISRLCHFDLKIKS